MNVAATGGRFDMVANPPENVPRNTPYLYYQGAGLDWLATAFGVRGIGARSLAGGKRWT